MCHFVILPFYAILSTYNKIGLDNISDLNLYSLQMRVWEGRVIKRH